MKRMWDAKLFFGRCPYTGNPCKVWECDSCEVEMQEREQEQLLDDKEYEEYEEGLDAVTRTVCDKEDDL